MVHKVKHVGWVSGHQDIEFDLPVLAPKPNGSCHRWVSLGTLQVDDVDEPLNPTYDSAQLAQSGF